MPDMDVMVRALKFTLSRVEKYFDEQKKLVDRAHSDIIENKLKQENDRIQSVLEFLTKKDVGITWLVYPGPYRSMFSVIRSALHIYLQDLQEAKERTGSNAFDELIQSAKSELTRKEFSDAEDGLFKKYWSPANRELGGKPEFFISYSTKDKEIAGKVAKVVEELGGTPFLAHDDITISNAWREEILSHLRSCSAIVCIVTPNFLESKWTSQEAGFVMGRERRVISLLFPGTELPGFLEHLQGKSASHTTIETDSREAIGHTLDLIRSGSKT